eukprot:CAMPEP_0183298044 /NCGR_PEP_ID=MMETSP0160_2-20130417/5174_1 /TAXON_ID=2839 ORGANISM="Odontella Sinensis, Strain Grunow 1884" /NCGR_SAMPLE_ID=MMETSP0160_2 /ASSEMBLY_ACC=CAM_ASM_000250 /LENGTH=356 /DNA_ID=CAMNT_0025459987 /DNA_START=91 /DNA_END=1158 /DNA_ORIENTATION=+
MNASSEGKNAVKKRRTITTEPALDDVIKKIEKEWGRCIGLFVHGSVVFLEGEHEPKDFDLLAVVDDPIQEIKSASPDSQFILGQYEVSIYSKDFWYKKLDALDITMVTCAFLPPRFILREIDGYADHVRQRLNLDILALSVISYAEYTWLKAKRVLDRWQDPYKSSKNVSFVFRILELGCQLAEHLKIVDLKAANHWWEEIKEIYADLNIQPGDFDIVEAAMASRYEAEIARFRQVVAASKINTGKDEEKEGGNCKEKNKVEKSGWHSDSCCICLTNLKIKSKVIKLVCGHQFHLKCESEWIRAKQSLADRCPVCQKSLRTKINKELAIKRELERRGIIQHRRYDGYPATIIVEEE